MKQTKIYGGEKSGFRIVFLIGTIAIFIGLFAFAFRNSDEGENLAFQERLPVIVIDTHGASLEANSKVEETVINGRTMRLQTPSDRYDASLKLYYKDPYENKNISNKPALETDVVMNVRGQSSLIYPKKQYTIRFVDDNGFKNPQEVLTMPKHDKWVLNGMYSDKSMMRNYIAYKMGRQTMEYSPDTRYVEVYIKRSENGSKEDEYQGIYMLTEKIERDPNRVPIGKNDEKYNDTSFIMARDKIKADDIVIQSDWNRLEDEYIIIPKDVLKMRTVFTVSYPNSTNITEKDRLNMMRSLNDFEYSLKSTKFRDKRQGYNNYIDADSFVNFAMINEITKNIDGGEVSTYFYKDLGQKIKAGPLWDFDMSLGNTGVEEVDQATGFLMLDTIWYDRLFQDEFFANRYKNTYRMYRNTIWNDENINLLIDEALLELLPAVEKNNAKWYPKDNIEDYMLEVEELRSFLLSRLKWMDENISVVKRITEDIFE